MNLICSFYRRASVVLKSRSGSFLYIAIFTILAGLAAYLPMAMMFKSTSNSARMIQAIHESDQVEELFRQIFGDVLLPHLQKIGDALLPLFACATTKWSDLSPINFPTAGFRIELMQNSSALIPSYTGDANHEAAKNRCNNAQSAGIYSIGDLRNTTSIYFCARLVPIGGAIPPPRIFQGGPVFAEATVFFMNFENNTPINCAGFKKMNNGGTVALRGLQVYYNLYWQKNIQRDVAGGSKGQRYYMHPGSLKVFSETP